MTLSNNYDGTFCENSLNVNKEQIEQKNTPSNLFGRV